MSNVICKCGHDEDDHQALSDGNDNNELPCFHRVGDDMAETWYCSCMKFEQDVVVSLANDIKAIEANYDALQSPMPCGHLARYAVNGEDGTQYCALCVLDATQVTITNLVNDDDDPDEKCPFCKTRATLKIVEKLLDSTPEIGAKFYDDVIANLINDTTSANSTFQCYCEEQ